MVQKKKIFEENVKTQHTTHWDWDYLSWEELEALTGRDFNKMQEHNHPQYNSYPRKSSKQALWGIFFIFLSVGILAMVILYR
jgi:hypothetical protein